MIKKLPVEIVLHPSWWNKHAGIVFDEDFFYHPLKRIEAERKMEQVLYDRFGKYGLGKDHDKNLPIIGPVHNAAGYLISEMLGCKIEYKADSAPQIKPFEAEELKINKDAAFKSIVFKRFENLVNALKTKYGFIIGDVNWSGVLNTALDVRGNNILTDMMIQPDETMKYFRDIASILKKFTSFVYSQTQSTSISVNRTVRHLDKPVFLHSQCSHTMIDEASYEQFLMPIDIEWSKKTRPYGIHYCGKDPHRFASLYAKIPHLDFLDLGWGGDVKYIREQLPNTFLNIRLDPVTIASQSTKEIGETIIRLVKESNNPSLTGVCCINMDDKVTDDKIAAIFETVEDFRKNII
jgi:hypothetical protein